MMRPVARARIAAAVWVLLSLARPGLSAAEGPLGPIHVAVNSRDVHGHCPAVIGFTATVDYQVPHPDGFVFNYHWERSDGAKTAVQLVRPDPNRRSTVIHASWTVGTGGQSYDLSETIFVNSGRTHLTTTSPTVHLACS